MHFKRYKADFRAEMMELNGAQGFLFSKTLEMDFGEGGDRNLNKERGSVQHALDTHLEN